MIKKTIIASIAALLLNCCTPKYAPISYEERQRRSLESEAAVERVNFWMKTKGIRNFLDGNNGSTVKDIINSRTRVLTYEGDFFYVNDKDVAAIAITTDRINSCNGIHIGGGYILTANHCVNPRYTDGNFKSRTFVDPNRKVSAISGLRGYPEYIRNSEEYDLGLLYHKSLSGKQAQISLFSGELKKDDKIVYFPIDSISQISFIRDIKKLEGIIVESNNISINGNIDKFIPVKSQPNIPEDFSLEYPDIFAPYKNIYSADMFTIQGASGSPVFVGREGKLYLCGIISNADFLSAFSGKDLNGNEIKRNFGNKTYFSGHQNIRKFLEDYVKCNDSVQGVYCKAPDES